MLKINTKWKGGREDGWIRSVDWYLISRLQDGVSGGSRP